MILCQFAVLPTVWVRVSGAGLMPRSGQARPAGDLPPLRIWAESGRLQSAGGPLPATPANRGTGRLSRRYTACCGRRLTRHGTDAVVENVGVPDELARRRPRFRLAQLRQCWNLRRTHTQRRQLSSGPSRPRPVGWCISRGGGRRHVGERVRASAATEGGVEGRSPPRWRGRRDTASQGGRQGRNTPALARKMLSICRLARAAWFRDAVLGTAGCHLLSVTRTHAQ